MATKQAAKGVDRKGKDQHGDKASSTQKTIQRNQSAKITQIMSSFSNSKPTNVDAQRIVCVLEALIEKVMILQYLDSDLFNNLNDKAKMAEKEELMGMLTDNSRLMLLRESDLEIKLKPLLGQQDLNIGDKTNDESSPTIDLSGLQNATAKNIRNMIREVQNNPQDLDIIKKLRRGGQNVFEDFEDFLIYLRGLKALMLKRLSTSVEEQASHDRQKEELDRKIHLWERTKANKESELANLKKEKEKYITEKDEELNKLKNQIDEIGANKDKKMKELEQESKRDQESMKKNFEEKEATLKKQLQSLQDDLKELRKKNKQEEDELRGKKTRDEAMLTDIIGQYDEMMESKENEITDLETELMKIEKEIKDYQESLTILKAEEQKEKEIAKKIAVKKELHDTEKDRINNIVQAIQNAWKFYKVKAKPGKKKPKKAKK